MSNPTVDNDGVIVESRNAASVFSDLDLARIKSFDDVKALFDQHDVKPESFEDYGTGFKIIPEKNTLVGVPFFAVEWRFNPSEYGGEDFVSVALVTRDGSKWIMNDGSTGIARQFKTVTGIRLDNGHPHPQAGLFVPDGLRRSDYQQVDEKGKPRQSTTYYLGE